MITGSQEYEQFLANIAEGAPSVLTMRLPTTEPIYEIDWNSRKVSAPPFIGVEGDHEAEIIYFQMDRYYDAIDLAEAIGMITFKNAKNEEYYYLIPTYDIYSIEDKIIFPWVIQAPVALYGGTVQFAIKFFKVDKTSNPKKLVYELNTIVARTKVLVGWANYNNMSHTYHTLNPESILLDNETIERLSQIIQASQYLQMYWIDV